jgi:hypothetical protein
MVTLVFHVRRLLLFFYTAVNLSSTVVIVNPATAWFQYWLTNRNSILMFTAVNTAVATGSEITSRTIFPLVTGVENQGFFVNNQAGDMRIHQQAVVSIIMTIFASLLGGPVYFMRRKQSRFVFFILFGTANSIVSQSLSFFLRDGVFVFQTARLGFDFFYNGSIKFLLFEFTRPVLLRLRQSYIKIGAVRVTQDFLTTFFRVVMLNLIGLKG